MDIQTAKQISIEEYLRGLGQAAGSEPLVQVTFEGGKRCLI